MQSPITVVPYHLADVVPRSRLTYPRLEIQVKIRIPKRRNSFASNRYAHQLRPRMSGRKISRTESWSRFHFAERTVQRR
jgi:hypothetical protein